MLSPRPADDELGNKYLHYDEVPFYMMPFSDDAVTYYLPSLCKFALVVKASGALIGRVFRYNNYHMLLEVSSSNAQQACTWRNIQEKFWKSMSAEPIMSPCNSFRTSRPMAR